MLLGKESMNGWLVGSRECSTPKENALGTQLCNVWVSFCRKIVFVVECLKWDYEICVSGIIKTWQTLAESTSLLSRCSVSAVETVCVDPVSVAHCAGSTVQNSQRFILNDSKALSSKAQTSLWINRACVKRELEPPPHFAWLPGGGPKKIASIWLGDVVPRQFNLPLPDQGLLLFGALWIKQLIEWICEIEKCFGIWHAVDMTMCMWFIAHVRISNTPLIYLAVNSLLFIDCLCFSLLLATSLKNFLSSKNI